MHPKLLINISVRHKSMPQIEGLPAIRSANESHKSMHYDQQNA